MKTLLATAAAAILVAGGAHAANLLVNGGFETGDFTGWTVNDPSGFTFVSAAFGSYAPNSGTYFAALGAIGGDGTVSQTFTDTPGVLYEASFFLASDGDTPNDFSVTGPGPLSLGPLVDIPASPYVEYFGFFTGSGSDTITFAARNDPGYLSLDDVSVTAVVPEPAAWASMILGLGLAGAALRRRKAIAAA
jgi:hypothetical protein